MARKSIAELEREILNKIEELERANKKLQDALDSPEKRANMRTLDLNVVKKRRDLEQLKKRLKAMKGRG